MVDRVIERLDQCAHLAAEIALRRFYGNHARRHHRAADIAAHLRQRGYRVAPARLPDQVKALEPVLLLQAVERGHGDPHFKQRPPLAHMVPGRSKTAEPSHGGIRCPREPRPGLRLPQQTARGDACGKGVEDPAGVSVVAEVAVEEHLGFVLGAARRGQPIAHTKIAAVGAHPQPCPETFALRLIEIDPAGHDVGRMQRRIVGVRGCLGRLVLIPGNNGFVVRPPGAACCNLAAGPEQAVGRGVGRGRKNLPGCQAGSREALGVERLRAGGDDDVIRIGHHENAQLRPLCDPVDQRDGIDRSLVARHVDGAAVFREHATQRDQPGGEHHAAEVAALCHQRGRRMPALPVADEVDALIAVARLDHLDCRRDQVELARGTTLTVFAGRSFGPRTRQMHVGDPKIARPARAGILQRGRRLLQIEIVRVCLVAFIY